MHLCFAYFFCGRYDISSLIFMRQFASFIVRCNCYRTIVSSSFVGASSFFGQERPLASLLSEQRERPPVMRKPVVKRLRSSLSTLVVQQACAKVLTPPPLSSCGDPKKFPAPVSGQRTHGMEAGREGKCKTFDYPGPSTACERLQTQQEQLREWFSDAHNGLNTVCLKKSKQQYKSERSDFHLSHSRYPTEKEVSRRVQVMLSPVSALKAYAASCAPSPSLEDALLLQQHARQHQLVQSGGRTWWRCLSCFHVFFARPRDVLTGPGGPVHLSWLEKEDAARRERLERTPAVRQRKRRWRSDTMHSASGRSKESVTCCPHCRSKRVQWMMEYAHYRTHG